MRTFSSAENRRRVRRWISRTTCSVLAPLPIGCLLPVGPGVSLSSTPYVVHIALTANTQATRQLAHLCRSAADDAEGSLAATSRHRSEATSGTVVPSDGSTQSLHSGPLALWRRCR